MLLSNMYGGAYSATLLNIPGDTPAVITALDGFQLTKKGKAGKSLATGNIASFIGGTIGILFLTILGPLLAEVGLKFGPTEIAALIFMSNGKLLFDGVKYDNTSFSPVCMFASDPHIVVVSKKSGIKNMTVSF